MQNIAVAFRVARYAKDEDFKDFVSVEEKKPIEGDLVCF